MYLARRQQFARDYLQQALLGTWAKTGKSEYRRVSGEIVKKVSQRWHGADLCWQSAYAAMSHIDYLNTRHERESQ